MGVYNAAGDLAWIVAPALGGLIAAGLGLDNLFRVVPLLALGAYFALVVWIRPAVALVAAGARRADRADGCQASVAREPTRYRGYRGDTVPDLRYDRLYRTPTSEAYLISDGDQPLACWLHFATTAVYGLLLFEREPGTRRRQVIAQVDEDIGLDRERAARRLRRVGVRGA